LSSIKSSFYLTSALINEEKTYDSSLNTIKNEYKSRGLFTATPQMGEFVSIAPL